MCKEIIITSRNIFTDISNDLSIFVSIFFLPLLLSPPMIHWNVFHGRVIFMHAQPQWFIVSFVLRLRLYLRIITYSYKFTTYYIIYIIIIITTIHRVGNKLREIRNEKLIWKTFSDDIIRVYNMKRVPTVFVNSNFHVPIPRGIYSYYINNNVTFRKSY